MKYKVEKRYMGNHSLGFKTKYAPPSMSITRMTIKIIM